MATKNIYNIHIIRIADVRNSRCHSAEITLQTIADSVDEIMCVMPYTLPVPPQKIARTDQNVGVPGLIPSFVIVTRRTEEIADTDSQGPSQG